MNNIDIKGTDKKVSVTQLKDKPYYYVHIVRKSKGSYTQNQEITDTYKVNTWEIKDAIRRAVALVVYREVVARFPHLYVTNYDGTIVIEQGYTRDIHIDCGVMDCKPVFNMFTKLHYGVDKVKNPKRRISIESVFKYVSDNEN